MGYIYKIINKVNGKMYIGQTSKMVQTRWKEHIYAANNKKCKDYDSILHRAIRKYQPKEFDISVVETIDNTLLDERETFWISYYDSFNNGYNMTQGGEGSRTIDYQRVYELWDKGCSIGDISKIIHCSDVQAREILKSHTGYSTVESFRRGVSYCAKEVFQYDYDGDLINRYRSAMEASRSTGISVSCILSVCNGHARTAGGYQWRSKDSKKNVMKIPYIFQYDLNGNFINKYKSLKEASDAVGVSSGAIGMVCAGKRKTSAGYLWKYEN